MLQSVLFPVELHVTVNDIKLSVSQWWFYVEFMSPTTKRNPVFMQSASYFCSILTKLGVWQIFIYVTKIKFHKNPSSRSRAGTYRHTETTNVIGTYRNYTYAPKRVKDIKHISLPHTDFRDHSKMNLISNSHRHTCCVTTTAAESIYNRTSVPVVPQSTYQYVTSGFCREVDEDCALLGYYAARRLILCPFWIPDPWRWDW